MKLSLVVQTEEVEAEVPVALLSGPFEKRLEKAAGLGYDGVELMTADPRELDVTKIRKQLDVFGLEVSAIGSGAVCMADRLTLLSGEPETGRQASERLFELIEFASSLEAPFVTIGGFRGRASWVGDKTARQQLSEILRNAGERASEMGVRLVLEPLNRYESDIINNTAEGINLLGEIGYNSLGLLLDTFHMNIEEPSLAGSFKLAGSCEKLWHVHIGDSNRLPPGKGHIDFGRAVAALREIGYEGYLSAELLPIPDRDRAAEETIRYMRAMVPGNDRERKHR